MEAIKEFLRNEEGATAVEYGLIAALIAGAIIFVFSGFRTGLKDFYDDIIGAIRGAATTVSSPE